MPEALHDVFESAAPERPSLQRRVAMARLETKWIRMSEHMKLQLPVDVRDEVSEALKTTLKARLGGALKAYREQGGLSGAARYGLNPPFLQNFLVQKMRMHIANAMGFATPWDAARLQSSWEAYTEANGWSSSSVALEVVHLPTDEELPSTAAAFVKVKDELTLATDRLLHVWCFITPTRTYLAGRFQFGQLDGTSIFNFLKGLVETYFTSIPPQTRSTSGATDAIEFDAQVGKQKFGLLHALLTAYEEALTNAYFQATGTPMKWSDAKNEQVVACVTFDSGTSAGWRGSFSQGSKGDSAPPRSAFGWMLASVAGAIKRQLPSMPFLYMVTPVSWQRRIYRPLKEARLVGHWLSSRTSWLDLEKLAAAPVAYTEAYHAVLAKEASEVSGACRRQIARNFLFGDSTLNTQLHRAFWLNNYGRRDVHPDAGEVEYFWGPNAVCPYLLLMNTVTLNGRTCTTFESQQLTQATLDVICEEYAREYRERSSAQPAPVS